MILKALCDERYVMSRFPVHCDIDDAPAFGIFTNCWYEFHELGQIVMLQNLYLTIPPRNYLTIAVVIIKRIIIHGTKICNPDQLYSS